MLPGSISGIMGNNASITPDASPHAGYVTGAGGPIPIGSGGVVNNGQQQLTKSNKKRKEGSGGAGGPSAGGDYESSSSNRDVQSPAYSDISDDSNAVAETEIMGKFFFRERERESLIVPGLDRIIAHKQINQLLKSIKRLLRNKRT